jgi:hypothetical protein
LIIWAMLDTRWLHSVTSWPAPIPASLIFSPVLDGAPWLVNYHLSSLPLVPVLEGNNSLGCAVEKGTCFRLDACWPAANRFPNSFPTCGL